MSTERKRGEEVTKNGNHHLSKKQKEIYDFCRSYIVEHGYAPSVREIGAAVQLKSTSSVHSHLQTLFKKGYLETDEEESGHPRAFRLAGYIVIPGHKY